MAATLGSVCNTTCPINIKTLKHIALHMQAPDWLSCHIQIHVSTRSLRVISATWQILMTLVVLRRLRYSVLWSNTLGQALSRVYTQP
jgi:hypothetical protein